MLQSSERNTKVRQQILNCVRVMNIINISVLFCVLATISFSCVRCELGGLKNLTKILNENRINSTINFDGEAKCQNLIANITSDFDEFTIQYNALITNYRDIDCEMNLRRTFGKKSKSFKKSIDTHLKSLIEYKLDVTNEIRKILKEFDDDIDDGNSEENIGVDNSITVSYYNIISEIRNMNIQNAARLYDILGNSSLETIVKNTFSSRYENYKLLIYFFNRIKSSNDRDRGYYHLFRELENIDSVNTAAGMSITYYLATINNSNNPLLNYIVQKLPKNMAIFPFFGSVKIKNEQYNSYINLQTFDSKESLVVDGTEHVDWILTTADHGISFKISSNFGKMFGDEQCDDCTPSYNARHVRLSKDDNLMVDEWQFEPTENGYFKIINVHLDEYLYPTGHQLHGYNRVFTLMSGIDYNKLDNSKSQIYDWEILNS